MPTGFRSLDPRAERVGIVFEGQPLSAPRGVSVAAALLAAGVVWFRDTPGSGGARGPLCLMGSCFECLLRIDGRPNRQGCMTPVRDGMRVERMHGASGGEQA